MWFEDTKRWSTNSFFELQWQWPAEELFPLSKALIRKNVTITEEDRLNNNAQLVTLPFSGEVRVRADQELEDVKGSLFLAEAGDLIYSKIDVRNGAIGIIPSDIERAAVTSEFPVYQVNPEIADSLYIRLLAQSNIFRQAINGIISGASGRKRVQPSVLEEMIIPLPSPEVQEAIIAPWRLAQEEIVAAQAGLRELYEELSAECYSLTTFAPDANPLKQRKVALNWDGLDVWDMKSARAGAFRTANPHFVPMRTIAQETTVLASPSREAEENPEKEWPVYGVNNREGVVFSHFQKGAAFNASYKRIQPNWFFHNPTRSAVGSLGIVPEGIETDAITSPEYQVWKIRDDRPDVPPDFIALLIRTTYFVDLVQVHRVGAVKQRLYTENLLDIPVPVFTEAQMQAYASRRRTTLERIAKARIAAKTAVLEVEEMILGKRPITD